MTRYRPPPAGKQPILPSIINRARPGIDPALVAEFANFFIPDLSDMVGRMYTLDDTIRPLSPPAPRLLGRALTVKCPPGDNIGMQAALTMVEPGDVMVIDAQGFTDWCLGGFQVLQLAIRSRGLKGLLVNGAYRDVTQAQEYDFPIYGRGIAPWSGAKRGPAEINVPVCAGGVIVHPGDLVVGDHDGIVIVPNAHVALVAEKLRDRPGLGQDLNATPLADLEEEEEARMEYIRTVLPLGH